MRKKEYLREKKRINKQIKHLLKDYRKYRNYVTSREEKRCIKQNRPQKLDIKANDRGRSLFHRKYLVTLIYKIAVSYEMKKHYVRSMRRSQWGKFYFVNCDRATKSTLLEVIESREECRAHLCS